MLKSFIRRIPPLHRLARKVKSLLFPPDKGFAQYSNATKADRYPEVFAYVRDYLTEKGIREARLLSYGCSTGEEVFSLRKYMPDARITGLDINRKNLKACWEKGPDAKMRFLYSDAKTLEENGPYDCIFAMSVLCRWPDAGNMEDISQEWPFEQFEDMLSKFDRVLQPGSLLVIYNANFRFRDSKLFPNYRHHPVEGVDESGFVHKFGKDNLKLKGYQDNEVVFEKVK